tara:strand:+ start:831 stop:1046 length:216 start_codon:yes stop_codon:yes gene_type:complete
MTLSDNVIAHVAQLVQIAILTGTDVVDHMRMMVLVDNEGTLELDEEYEQRSEENVQRMIREAVAMQGENAE